MSEKDREPEVVCSSPDPDPKLEPGTSIDTRRKFLTKSSLLMAVVGLSGCATLHPDGKGVSSVQGQALQKVMEAAIANGDIEAAIKLHGRNLPETALASLRQLDRTDLEAARRLDTKLSGLHSLADNNNGVVGM